MTRLHREGRFAEYTTKRDALKLEGVDPVLCWRYALAYFPPLNGSPQEVKDLPPIADEPGTLDGTDYEPDDTPRGPKPSVTASPPPEEVDFILDGAEYSADESSRGPVPEPRTVTPAIKPPPAVDPAGDPEKEDYSEVKERGEKRIPAIWRRLYRRIPKKRKANPAIVTDWLFNNIDVDVEELHSKDIPNRGALTLLKHIQTSPIAYREFIKENWLKTMPTRQELMSMEKTGDKHKAQMNLLDAFEADYYAREEERERLELAQEQGRK